MLNLADTDPKYYMHWDYRDMISNIDLGGGGFVFYNYDSEKQRSRKVIEDLNGNKQSERIYLGGVEIYKRYDIIEEIESIHLMDGDHRFLLVEDVLECNTDVIDKGVLYRYQYSNHLGSAVLELNENAIIISYEEYHPYGTTAFHAKTQNIKAAAKRYRYTGKERDEESGLYYHGARYYAPWLGRWVSCDPMGLVDNTNLFVYVRCNPILLLDSNGKYSGQVDEPQYYIEKINPKTGGLHYDFFINLPPISSEGLEDPNFFASEIVTTFGEESKSDYFNRKRILEESRAGLLASSRLEREIKSKRSNTTSQKSTDDFRIGPFWSYEGRFNSARFISGDATVCLSTTKCIGGEFNLTYLELKTAGLLGYILNTDKLLRFAAIDVNVAAILSPGRLRLGISAAAISSDVKIGPEYFQYTLGLYLTEGHHFYMKDISGKKVSMEGPWI